jgi:hypothetical protein
MASFTQHHADQFDLKLSATENFAAMFPDQVTSRCDILTSLDAADMSIYLDKLRT